MHRRPCGVHFGVVKAPDPVDQCLNVDREALEIRLKKATRLWKRTSHTESRRQMGEEVLAAHNPKVHFEADPVVVLCEAQDPHLYGNNTQMVALGMQRSPDSQTG